MPVLNKLQKNWAYFKSQIYFENLCPSLKVGINKLDFILTIILMPALISYNRAVGERERTRFKITCHFTIRPSLQLCCRRIGRSCFSFLAPTLMRCCDVGAAWDGRVFLSARFFIAAAAAANAFKHLCFWLRQSCFNEKRDVVFNLSRSARRPLSSLNIRESVDLYKYKHTLSACHRPM